MPFLKNVLGLDLGSHSIKAVELAQGLRSVEVVRFHAEPRDPEQSRSPSQLTRMLSTHSFRRDNVVAALRGDRISVRRLVFPFAEKRRLAQAVPFELEDKVPFDLDRDGDRLGARRARRAAGAGGVGARAAHRGVRADRDAAPGALRRADHRERGPRAREPAPRRSSSRARACSSTSATPRPRSARLRDGVAVSARSIGIAGRAFTEAIAQERSLSLDQAERWKHERGIAEPGVGSPFPRADGGARPARERDPCASRSRSRRSSRAGSAAIVLLGGGAQLDRHRRLARRAHRAADRAPRACRARTRASTCVASEAPAPARARARARAARLRRAAPRA